MAERQGWHELGHFTDMICSDAVHVFDRCSSAKAMIERNIRGWLARAKVPADRSLQRAVCVGVDADTHSSFLFRWGAFAAESHVPSRMPSLHQPFPMTGTCDYQTPELFAFIRRGPQLQQPRFERARKRFRAAQRIQASWDSSAGICFLLASERGLGEGGVKALSQARHSLLA